MDTNQYIYTQLIGFLQIYNNQTLRKKCNLLQLLVNKSRQTNI
ncbi:hypothetical protein pb186bvf_007979 [Paramecium bursaria]